MTANSDIASNDQKSRILEGLADGMSLRAICREPGMPHVATVMRWCADDKEWCEQYARARAAGDDAMAEDIQAIADDTALDPNDRRVKIDARKWLLGKRQPKKYGDKIGLTDGDGGPLQIVVQQFSASNPDT